MPRQGQPPSALGAGIRALPGGSTNQSWPRRARWPEIWTTHHHPCPPPVPLLEPAQPPGSPLSGWQPPQRLPSHRPPFLQRHSVPIPYRRHLGLYSCYRGNKGTQSPQLPWSHDPAWQVPPPFPIDKNPWREYGLGAPHPPAPSGLCLYVSPPPQYIHLPQHSPTLKKGSRLWRKFSV